MKHSTRVVALMAVTFGIIGLERMVIAFVMPDIQREFDLSHTQVGAIVSIFGFTCAFGSSLMGSLSDYVGRRVVFVTLVIFGGLCNWLTGIATSFIMLLPVRAIMGFAEGGVMSPLYAAVAEESAPRSRTRNVSVAAGCMMLFGGVVGPILNTVLMTRFRWRWVFYMFAVPAIYTGMLIVLFVREPA